MALLEAAADTLAAVASACEDPLDAADLSELATRITNYLSTSRSTTTLGMPRIVSVSNELSDDMVVRQEHGGQSTHVRIVRP